MAASLLSDLRGCAGALALMLVACGAPPASRPTEAPAPATLEGLSATAPAARQPAFVIDHIRKQNPYWVNLLQQSDGGVVQQAPQTIFRYPDRTAEVWIQILHPAPLTERFEDAETIENITFQRERYRYLFNCPRREFTVTERRIMGDGETVSRTVTYEPAGTTPQWRPLAERGPASYLFGPACVAE